MKYFSLSKLEYSKSHFTAAVDTELHAVRHSYKRPSFLPKDAIVR